MPVTELLHHPLVEHAAVAEHESDYKQHVQYIMSGAESLDVVTTEDTSIGANGITGNGGSSSLNITLPSNCLLDRNILLEVTVVATPSVGGMLGGFFCPRQWPIANAINNLAIQVNNITMTDAPSAYASVFGRYKTTQDYLKKYRSLSPSQPDRFNRYEPYNLTAAYTAIRTVGGNTYPTAAEAGYTTYPSSIFDGVCNNMDNDDYDTRGAFPFTFTEDSIREVNSARTYTFTEPLLHSFCINREGSGVAHVRTLAVQINWGKIERMFCQINAVTNCPHAGDSILATATNPSSNQDIDGNNGAAATFKITKVRLITKIAMPSIPIVPRHEIAYNDFKFYTQGVTVGSNGSCSVQFNSVSLGTVPSHVFIYVRQKAGDRTRFDADGYLAVNKLNITVGGRSGNLVNWTPRNLYLASVENGVNMNWDMFSKTLGSVICLGFGKDIPGVLPGLRRTIDFSFSGDFTNTTYFDPSGISLPLDNTQTIHDYQWEACALFVTPALLTVEESSASEVVGISESEAHEALNDGPSHDSLEHATEPVGGSVGSWLKRNFRKGVHFVKRFVAPGLTALSSVVPELAPIASTVTRVSDAANKLVGEGLSKHRRLHSRMGRGLLMN
jgi:lipopolysaccharide export system protein LptC